MNNLEFMETYFRLKKSLNDLSSFIDKKTISRHNKEIFKTLSSITADARICGKICLDNKPYTKDDSYNCKLATNHMYLRDYFFGIATISILCEDAIQSILYNSKAKTIPLKKIKPFYKTMTKIAYNLDLEHIDYEINLIKDGMGD